MAQPSHALHVIKLQDPKDCQGTFPRNGECVAWHFDTCSDDDEHLMGSESEKGEW